MQNLTPQERLLIVEALLYTGIPDVDADWSDDKRKSMIILAQKLNDLDMPLEDIYVLGNNPFNIKGVRDGTTFIEESLKKNFPNIPHLELTH